jgi:hypothetical protein
MKTAQYESDVLIYVVTNKLVMDWPAVTAPRRRSKSA